MQVDTHSKNISQQWIINNNNKKDKNNTLSFISNESQQGKKKLFFLKSTSTEHTQCYRLRILGILGVCAHNQVKVKIILKQEEQMLKQSIFIIHHTYRTSSQSSFLYNQPSWTFVLLHPTLQQNDCTSSTFPVTLWTQRSFKLDSNCRNQ